MWWYARSWIGGFCENRPSQYTPRPGTATARKSSGIAAEASRHSTQSSSPVKSSKCPVRTSTAPIWRVGAPGSASELSKLLEVEELVEAVAKLVRAPRRELVGTDLGEDHQVPQALDADQDLIEDPIPRIPRRRRVPEVAAASGSASGVSLRRSPSQASAAQMAPPEVPLRATTSTSLGRLAQQALRGRPP